jgi:Na+/H+ antiporter NhaD/arsenite permease-like protein
MKKEIALMSKVYRGAAAAAGCFILIMLCLILFLPHEAGDIEAAIGAKLSFLTVIPFGAILLAIAVLPLAVPHFWESNLNKGVVAALCGLPIFIYFVAGVDHGGAALLNLAHEYYSFIILLAALFTISGGIFLEGDIKATPRVNVAFLGLGGILASFIGTTGAAMLLVRPLLRTNSERHHVKHIFIFFIFIVANIGGSLTPLGDPPLFLGFLRGVPFLWTFNLWPQWLLTTTIVLTVFYVWDTLAYRHETKADLALDQTQIQPLRIRGKVNFLFLALVLASILCLKDNLAWFREPVMVLLAIVSYLLDATKTAAGQTQTPREMNKFTFAAIIEVGVLFAGIFVTMLPAICLLKAKGATFGVDQPWQFFWLSGGLSSFLDNAPTYVTYMSLGQGLAQGLNLCAQAGSCVAGVPAAILAAVSCGSVFMGANTYIGNAPNFMVKSIVDEAGVKMPSFFGYMAYSVGILVPVFLIDTFIFF